MAKYPDVTNQQQEDLINKIGGIEGMNGLQSGEKVVVDRTVLEWFKARSVAADNNNGGVTYAAGLDVEKFRNDWQKFYADVLNMQMDFSTIELPSITSGFGWGVVVAPGLTPQKVYDACKALFLCWKYTEDQSLDEVIDLTKEANFASEKPYVVWVRDRVEADEEHKNRSARQLEADGVNGITLLERLFLELWYFWKTGKHLDVQNVTLCAGSRRTGGFVPCVRWRGDGYLHVDWYDVGHAFGYIRVREVISLPKAA